MRNGPGRLFRDKDVLKENLSVPRDEKDSDHTFHLLRPSSKESGPNENQENLGAISICPPLFNPHRMHLGSEGVSKTNH